MSAAQMFRLKIPTFPGRNLGPKNTSEQSLSDKKIADTPKLPKYQN